MVVSKSKRKRKMERIKKAKEKKAARAKTNQKLIIGPLIVLAIIGGIYLFGGSDNIEVAETSPTTMTSEQAEVIGMYKTLNRPSTHEPGKVKIQEFMSFYCDHCYTLIGLMDQLEGKYAGKVEVELRPIYWGDGSSKPGEAYIIAESLGYGHEMRDALFTAVFVGGRDVGNEDTLIDLAKGVGMGDEFAAKLKSGEGESLAKENLRLSGVYEIQETPTLIVDGNLKITPHETGDDVVLMAGNLDRIIQAKLGQ